MTRWIFVFAAIWLGGLRMAFAATLPAAEQSALIVNRCALCHDDATRTGGMSLEHYDAATAPPSLAVMILSQLTNGVPFANYTASTPDAVAVVGKGLRNGAINAAGKPVPSKATVDALVASLVAQAKGASEWTVRETDHVAHSSLAGGRLLTASQMREVPSTQSPGDSIFYQLTLTCDPAKQWGEMQLAWSPLTQTGHTFVVTADGQDSTYMLDGKESAFGPSGLATRTSVALSTHHSTQLALPAESLAVSGVFPGETAAFDLATLPASTRAQMAGCFPGKR